MPIDAARKDTYSIPCDDDTQFVALCFHPDHPPYGSVKILFSSTDWSGVDDELQSLDTYGLPPGTMIRLLQRRPTGLFTVYGEYLISRRDMKAHPLIFGQYTDWCQWHGFKSLSQVEDFLNETATPFLEVWYIFLRLYLMFDRWITSNTPDALTVFYQDTRHRCYRSQIEKILAVCQACVEEACSRGEKPVLETLSGKLVAGRGRRKGNWLTRELIRASKDGLSYKKEEDSIFPVRNSDTIDRHLDSIVKDISRNQTWSALATIRSYLGAFMVSFGQATLPTEEETVAWIKSRMPLSILLEFLIESNDN